MIPNDPKEVMKILCFCQKFKYVLYNVIRFYFVLNKLTKWDMFSFYAASSVTCSNMPYY